jgi:hypothetical protein
MALSSNEDPVGNGNASSVLASALGLLGGIAPDECSLTPYLAVRHKEAELNPGTEQAIPCFGCIDNCSDCDSADWMDRAVKLKTDRDGGAVFFDIEADHVGCR